MKLLLVTNVNFNPQVERLTRRARDLGHRISLLQIGTTLEGIRGDTSLFDSIDYAFSGATYNRRSMREVMGFGAAMNQALEKAEPDAVWCLCMWDLSLFAIALARLKGLGAITTICGSDFYGHLANWQRRVRMRLMCGLSHLVTTTSETTRKDSERRLWIRREEQLCVHWGVRTSVFKMQLGQFLDSNATESSGQHPVRINLGRMLRRICFYRETLLALRQLRTEGLSFQAVALNAGVESIALAEFSSLVLELGLTDCVALRPAIATEEHLAEFYNSCDISLNLISRDQLGTSILEALACGNQLITTHLPQYDELVEKGTVLTFVPVSVAVPDLIAVLRQAVLRCGQTFADASINQKVVREHYNFECNTQKMFDQFVALTSWRPGGTPVI